MIASTIYKSVPGDVRDLFLQERNNETYLRVIILTIASGIATLVLGVLDHAVSGLALLGVGVLTAVTCIGLIVVTRRLLEYFDPSKLALPLMRQLSTAIQTAAAEKSRDVSFRQTEAHTLALRAITSYRHLAQLLEESDLRNATAPVVLSRQLIYILKLYSSWKHAIPTGSNWWSRVPRHQNWLTPSHGSLDLALNTSVGLPPQLQPDYLWFENAVGRALSRSLKVAFQSQGGADALAMSEEVADLVGQLTARLQNDEAVAIATMWERVVMAVVATPKVASADADDYELRLNQMAAAESVVRPVTVMLLGLSRAATSLRRRDLSAEFEAGLSNKDGLAASGLPTETRQMLENFATAIRREVASEGRRITPAWWVDHLAARSLADALLQTEAGIIGLVRDRALKHVSEFNAAGRPDLAAVAGMASLELLNKFDHHEDAVRRAEERLGSFRNSNIGIDRWPTHAESLDAASQHRSLLGQLAALLPTLRTAEFDPREPDLYGQLYQFVVDGAFHAILDGDSERGLRMYSAALAEMESARARIMSDLKQQEAQTRLVYALEPLITAMDLAGYALLMYELDGSGIWPEVKTKWDRLLDASPQLPSFLLTAAKFVEDTFALTVGGVERSRRTIALGQVLKERNLGSEWEMLLDESDERPHPSPIVSAFAPRGLGVQEDLYALFIAEYLAAFLEEDVDLGHTTRLIAEEIARYRAERPVMGHDDGEEE
ncbi:hypothetical protein [Microbacterium sp. CH1]|uniref:hypothetical protein n=1 Tax=Microbacterium sp. CH1 TaxID=1770208 RepID=UPI0018D40648|nr:hypothetical protein [Microbacterium sp. CH1]